MIFWSRNWSCIAKLYIFTKKQDILRFAFAKVMIESWVVFVMVLLWPSQNFAHRCMWWYWCIIWYNLIRFCTFYSDFKYVILPWNTLYVGEAGTKIREKSQDCRDFFTVILFVIRLVFNCVFKNSPNIFNLFQIYFSSCTYLSHIPKW